MGSLSPALLNSLARQAGVAEESLKLFPRPYALSLQHLKEIYPKLLLLHLRQWCLFN